MKKVAVAVLSFAGFFAFAQTPTASSGEGTPLKIFVQDNHRIEDRIHRQEITIGNLSNKENRRLYSDYSMKPESLIGELQIGEKISAYEILIVTDLSDSSCEVFLKITTPSSQKGFIFLNKNDNPYKNGNGQLLKLMTYAGESFMIRKYEQVFYPLKKLVVYDNPRRTDSTVLFTIEPDDNNALPSLSSLAITDNWARIDGMTDHWVKIVDKKQGEGWVFGGYLINANDKYKYLLPNVIVYSYLGDY